MKKANKKTAPKKAKKPAGIILPAHAVMPDFSGKKRPWPPKFTHIGMIGFNSVPKDQMNEMGDPLPGHKGSHGFVIQWGAEGIGFGEYTFVQKDDGTIECETECSGPKFTEALIAAWLKKITFKS